MRVRCWLLLCLSDLALAASTVSANKCTDARGQVSYQQMPCPAQSRAEQLEVEGEIDAARSAEARARSAANAPAAPPPAAVHAAPAPQTPPPARPKVVCPATQENPGRAPALGTDAWAMAINRDWYSRLPSRTSLKNAGRWPRECD